MMYWRKMDMWYKFSGHNLQAVYGFGTRAQADAYAAYLNRDRGANMYGHQPLAEDDAEATRLAGGGLVDITVEGVNLTEELSATKEG